MKRRRKIGDVGIRLKPNESNLLVNYNHFRKTKRKRKRKIKHKKTVTKSIVIKKNIDPLLKIMADSKNKSGESDIIIEEKKSDKKSEEKSEEKKSEEKKSEEKKSEEKKSEEKKSEEKKSEEIKKVRVEKTPQDLSEKDPNVKSLKITVSIEPDKKKKGHNIKLN